MIQPTSEAPDTPLRVISLAPSLTEILFAIHAGDLLVGVTDMCDFPPEAKSVAPIGSFTKPNMERLLSLQPDRVVTMNTIPEGIAASLESAGIEIVTLRQSSIWDLFPAIETCGRLLGRSQEASALSESLQSRLKRISSLFSEVPLEQRPRVFLEIWHDPLTAPGRQSFLHEVIQCAGGVNVTGGLEGDYVTLSHDAVVSLNPSVIILAETGSSRPSPDEVGQRIGWESIEAVKARRVIVDIDPSLLLRPGPRVIEGIEALYRQLYQEPPA